MSRSILRASAGSKLGRRASLARRPVPASRPTTSTKRQRQRPATAREPPRRRRANAAARPQRRHDAHAQSAHQQQRVLDHHQPRQQRAAKSGGPHQRQLAAPFQHAAQLHGGQSERAQQQSQPAQALKRRQIRVLHGEKRGQPIGAGLGVESIIAQRTFQRLAHGFGRSARRGVDQEKAVAADLRESVRETAVSPTSTSP